MKRGKKLLGLLAVLVLLLCAAFLVNKWNPENQAEEDSPAVTLFDTAAEAVTGLSWTYEGQELAFTRSGGSWSYPADSAFPTDSSALEALLAQLLALTADKTITAPEDLGDYGLDQAACEITFTADTVHRVVIGDETSMGGQRYLYLGGEDIHLVDSAILDTFCLGLYDVLALESVPEMTDLLTFTVESADRTFHLEHRQHSGLAYSDQYTWFLQEDDRWLALDNDLLGDFTAVITGLALDNCVDYAAGAGELAACGLEDATLVTVTYTATVSGQTTSSIFQLELGAATGEGCYVRLAGSDMVYLVDASVHTDMLQVTYDDLRPRDVLLMDWDTVEQVDITLDGTAHQAEKTVSTVTAEDGTSTEEAVWTLDGADADVQSVLDRLNAMASEDIASQSPAGDALLSFVFHRNAETFTRVELAFYPWDDDSALVTLDGESTVVISLASMDSLTEAVNGLFSE